MYWFLASDAFVRTNRRSIVHDVRTSVCPSVRLGRACIVMIQCNLVWI